MPLVAELDGTRMVSIDLDDDAWDALRLRSRGGALRFSGCGAAAYLRTSRRGLRHFVHAPGTGSCDAHGKESPAHMQAKALIVAAARAAGWQAEPEVPGPGYQADVLATSPTGVRLNFEVQLAREGDTDYRTRSERRVADGCRVLWLTRYPLAPRHAGGPTRSLCRTRGPRRSGSWRPRGSGSPCFSIGCALSRKR